MEFGIKKCGVVVLKRGKLCKSEGIKYSLSWYVRNSEEALLRKVGDSNVVNISETVDPKEYKLNEVKETGAEKNAWAVCERKGRY